MIGALLPAAVESVESFHDPVDLPALFPEEEALLAKAVDKRRREFTTVRACARTALGRLGHAPSPILPGQRGAPRWPTGVIGSMTHCEGYRAAAVAHARDVMTIGLDAEPHEPLPNAGVRALVTRPEEREQLARLAARQPGVCWDRLVFSAKESVYKAWFPLTGLWLDFEDAVVEVDPGAETFTARLLDPAPLLAATGNRLAGFSGRWRVRDGLIVTAIAVPATA
ncbi:4'-phosphopantetheinyl transferase family protein [Streptomyces griseocarneus]|uniref:4'-phosphopantetheinyl transferase family protein n=1 Tax=Streptomyces griseocarneus TaxID=51201 RepID=UPI00167E11BA|nr:4'-phosphopantetheinyl transferase superfamily protein [Streptomyces griseocarneus]MBZ6475557.1 4'-phosphopantetheinyl transferase superfamily protein [Streptomyces griseocarneus]